MSYEQLDRVLVSRGKFRPRDVTLFGLQGEHEKVKEDIILQFFMGDNRTIGLGNMTQYNGDMITYNSFGLGNFLGTVFRGEDGGTFPGGLVSFVLVIYRQTFGQFKNGTQREKTGYLVPILRVTL